MYFVCAASSHCVSFRLSECVCTAKAKYVVYWLNHQYHNVSAIKIDMRWIGLVVGIFLCLWRYHNMRTFLAYIHNVHKQHNTNRETRKTPTRPIRVIELLTNDWTSELNLATFSTLFDFTLDLWFVNTTTKIAHSSCPCVCMLSVPVLCHCVFHLWLNFVCGRLPPSIHVIHMC